jgi:hypothetical protein
VSKPGLGACALAALITAAAAAGGAETGPNLTAAQIVEKNVAARGGLEAWRKIRTMAWTGHIETGNPTAPIVPFVFELKRPNKTRFEIREEQDRVVRVFDGSLGWKVRNSRSGAPGVKPYTAEELRSAHEAQGIDGLLIDHQAKGIEVALDGSDEVEGRKAYRLAVTLPSGSLRHVWVDADTFLELKYDRPSHAPAGRRGTVTVSYRSYRAIDGLQIPMTIETGSAGRGVEKMVIDSVTLNPLLSDARFARPNDLGPHHALPGLRTDSPAGSDAPRAMESK